MIAGVHSEKARLQRKIHDREIAHDVAIADLDLAVADRDKVWDLLAQLASGFSFPVASAPASLDSKRNRRDSIRGLPSKRSWVSGDFSPLTPNSIRRDLPARNLLLVLRDHVQTRNQLIRYIWILLSHGTRSSNRAILRRVQSQLSLLRPRDRICLRDQLGRLRRKQFRTSS